LKTLIPHTREDITKELVEGLLRTKFPGITVDSIETLREIHGTASNIYLKVDHRGADKLPGRMWLKTGLPTVHLDRVLTLGLYAREAKFYSELQPLLKMRLPDCYAAVADEASGRGVVILEDLNQAGATFPGCIKPLSVDLVASGLDQLADLHSRSWEREWLYSHKIETFNAPGSAQEKYLRFWGVDYIAGFLNGPVGEVVPREVRDAQRVYDALWGLQPRYQREPFCLLHGDAHLGNSYITANNELGILDWQIYIIGPWAHDFSYYLVGGLSVDDRRRFERELLEHYLNRMSLNGVVEINQKEAWDNYRRFIAYGYWIWLRAPPAQQPIENNIAMSERFGAAMADHQVFQLLGV
jgi:Phosphotransferase enzyme family